MQDARLRLFSVIILSIAAFVSVAGALLTVLWLMLYPDYLAAALRSRALYLLLSLIGLVALVMTWSGGDGISYMVRTGVLILLGFTIVRGWSPGEFLDLSVWIFGRKTGFDTGLAIEMTMQGFDEASREWSRIRTVLQLKGVKPGIRSIPPLGVLLIHTRLLRARDQSDLLITRGYHAGGTCCPVFRRTKKDIIASFCTILILSVAFFPVRDIFILVM